MKSQQKNASLLKSFTKPKNGDISITYVGRGGFDMHKAVTLLFNAFKKGLELHEEHFKKLHFYFVGTSYAPNSTGAKCIQPLAEAMGIGDHVSESTDRIGFYDSIATLQNAAMLFIPGSDDPRYTASKLFPYILSEKPMLAIFHEESSAVEILKSCSPDAKVFTFPDESEKQAEGIYQCLYNWATGAAAPLRIDNEAFNAYSASAMAAKQVALFNKVLISSN